MNFETTKAYFAGLFDGEGSLFIHRSNANPHQRTLRVKVTNQSFDVLESIKTIFGGSVSQTTDQNRCKHWVIMGEPARHFLLAIRPYSRIKAEQIDVALEFFELRKGLLRVKHTAESASAADLLQQRILDLRKGTLKVQTSRT